MKDLFKKLTKIATFSVFATVAFAGVTHTVQKGETLYSISRQYGKKVDEIRAANGMGDDAVLKAGQELVIPGVEKNSSKNSEKSQGQTKVAPSSDGKYTVQKGDTWYGIARSFGISAADLQALNGLDSSSTLKIGQKIKVPSPSSNSSNSTAIAKSSQGKNSSSSSAANSKLPDLKTNDPRIYSDKKGDSSLVWPVKTSSVTYVKGKVNGVNLAAKKNEEVSAIQAGTVMFSGSYRGFGNVVFIQSKTGHIYAYTGLGSVKVAKGDYIIYGEQIGTAGIDSYSQKPQMTLMVFQNGLPIDPAKAPRG